MEPQATAHPPAPFRRSRWVFVPPPPLFALMFVAGLQVNRVMPVQLVPAAASAASRMLGFGLLAAAVMILLPAPLLFLLRRTTIIPHASASALVTSGPYQFTRNPMYLALAIAHVGLSLVFDSVWPLVFLALPIWVLQTRVIPFEEATLARIFGAEYESYRRRVRRWL